MTKSICWDCGDEMLWKIYSTERKETKEVITKVCKLRGRSLGLFGAQMFHLQNVRVREDSSKFSSSASILRFCDRELWSPMPWVRAAAPDPNTTDPWLLGLHSWLLTSSHPLFFLSYLVCHLGLRSQLCPRTPPLSCTFFPQSLVYDLFLACVPCNLWCLTGLTQLFSVPVTFRHNINMQHVAITHKLGHEGGLGLH